MNGFILFCLISLVISSEKDNSKIQVEYDSTLDAFKHNNKTYIPYTSESSLISFNSTHPSSFSESVKEENSCEEELVRGPKLLFFIFMVAFLTLFAGIMSGLTVGYLSIDDLVMELRLQTGTEEEKHYANLVLPVLSNRHWLLVTLLLMNSFAMEALPVFLDRIVSRVLAVVISVTLILAFGEVIPQALCTGPNQVKIAAYLAPLTRFLMVISWPLSFWIGKALDIILGEHHKTRYLNTDLKALVELHTFQALKELAEEEEKHPYIPKEDIARPTEEMGLTDIESKVMLGALGMRDKTIKDVMIPFKNVFLLSYEEKIDQKTLKLLLDSGFSRIPVYTNNNRNDVIGVLRIKKLITLDINQNKSLKELSFKLRPPLVVHPDIKINELFSEFLKGKSHMAFVTEQVDKLQAKLGLNRTNSILVDNPYLLNQKGDLGILILGIITLEDVLNKVFQMNIIDEDDYEKNRRKQGIAADRTRSGIRSMSKLILEGNKEMRNKFVKDQSQTFFKKQSQKVNDLIRENTIKKKNEKEEFLEMNSQGKNEQNNLNEKLV